MTTLFYNNLNTYENYQNSFELMKKKKYLSQAEATEAIVVPIPPPELDVMTIRKIYQVLFRIKKN